MANLFLTNNNLEKLVSSLKISQEQKDSLISKVSQLDEEERIRLLETLKEVYFLDLEEQQAVEELRINWQE